MSYSLKRSITSFTADTVISPDTIFEKRCRLAPYLNGGLFTENALDGEHDFQISDQRFEGIFDFLENYNFTIAEDSPLDQEVAVDPEMIGKVYESLVNVSDEADERGERWHLLHPPHRDRSDVPSRVGG